MDAIGSAQLSRPPRGLLESRLASDAEVVVAAGLCRIALPLPVKRGVPSR